MSTHRRVRDPQYEVLRTTMLSIMVELLAAEAASGARVTTAVLSTGRDHATERKEVFLNL